MRTMLLEPGGKAILVYKEVGWICSKVLWEADPVNDEIWYLVKEISKPSVEGAV
jgi:hypothetical protein